MPVFDPVTNFAVRVGVVMTGIASSDSVIRIRSGHREVDDADGVGVVGAGAHDRVDVEAVLFTGAGRPAARRREHRTGQRAAMHVDVVVVELIGPRHLVAHALAAVVAGREREGEHVAVRAVDAGRFAVGRRGGRRGETIPRDRRSGQAERAGRRRRRIDEPGRAESQRASEGEREREPRGDRARAVLVLHTFLNAIALAS